MSYTIYKYTSRTSGMSYIGATRMTKVARAGKNGMNYVLHCPFFGDAIREYGWDDFDYTILNTTESRELAEIYEKEYISLYNTQWPNGYNSSIGGFASALGCKKRQETKDRIARGHWKKIVQMSMNGEVIEEYLSLTEASRKTGVPCSNISNCCKGTYKRHSAGGYLWRYA